MYLIGTYQIAVCGNGGLCRGISPSVCEQSKSLRTAMSFRYRCSKSSNTKVDYRTRDLLEFRTGWVHPRHRNPRFKENFVRAPQDIIEPLWRWDDG